MKNNLKDKYPILYRNWTWDDIEEPRCEYAKRDALLRANEDNLPHGMVYLKSGLHDSEVLSFERTDTSFTLRLNDSCAGCFCHEVNVLLGKKVPREQMVFPLELVFSNVSRLVLSYPNRADKTGKLVRVGTQYYLQHLYAFLYDDVRILEEGRIALGICFWPKKRIKKQKRDLIFEIEAERLHFRELQRLAFAEICGTDLLEVFDLFMAEREKRKIYFDSSGSRKFLDACLSNIVRFPG